MRLIQIALASPNPTVGAVRSNTDQMLGMAYMNLKEAPRDVVQADMWLRLAAGRGDPLASGQRSKLESQMTRDRIAQAEALAAAWKPKVTAGPGAEKKN